MLGIFCTNELHLLSGYLASKEECSLLPFKLMAQVANKDHFYLISGRYMNSQSFIAAVQETPLFHNFASKYVTTQQKSERCDHLVTVVVGECQSIMLNKTFKQGEGKHTPSFFLPPCLSLQFQAVKACTSNCLCSPENERNLLDISKYF